jgi:hypothetical protein
MGAIQDEQLTLDQNGLSNHGARPVRTKQPGDIRDDVDERAARSRMAEHGDKIAKCRNLQKLTIRQGQACEAQKQICRKLLEWFRAQA